MSKHKKNTQNPRLAAVQALSEVLDEHKNLGDSEALSRLRDSRDNAMARNLAYGVLRWLTALEWLASQLLAKPLKKREVEVQRLLMLGLQQLWHDRTASHAAVNETAECARLLGKPWAVGLINAVLRRFQREQESLLIKMEQTEKRFAHPNWLLKEIQSDWPEHWQEIIDSNNRQAPLWLRINRQQADETVLRGDLKDAGFEVSDHDYARDAISISPAAAVARIPGFDNGWLSVQDPAAQLARDLLDPRSGDRILDACAAPGGKTAHLLESCQGIELTVLDRQAQRIEQIDQNLRRLGLDAKSIAADATAIESWWKGEKFHKILLDAPCSATGVIRRHPEIKWLRSSQQVDTVVQTQAGLLTALWPLLEPGGILVYATCSVLKRENSQQIQRFLEQHADAAVEIPSVEWGMASLFGRQILPGEARMDGFFYAVLRKSS
ncbi:MAG: 16S rRNA (cytosine(967)-C(5))-methyltransferase RsmB [Xanthomonadales bacterium]|nr:16S rRNA (cytosine(967)-C(5))-methyltransferase RsmB [Xanthomonadales bacterium]